MSNTGAGSADQAKNYVLVTAIMRAAEGREDDFIAVMKELAAAVRSGEPGNLEYSLHRSQKESALFLILEKYRSAEALKEHLMSAHFQAASKKLAGLVEGGLGLETYKAVF